MATGLASKNRHDGHDESIILGVLRGANLVYTVNTGGGKTLLAEILAYRWTIKHRNGLVLFILPFVSLISERAEIWNAQQFADGYSVTIEEYHGTRIVSPFRTSRRKPT